MGSYFKGEGGDPLIKDSRGRGWFPTGDVATIDADGFMQITDRSKDVIKSGGEWISSIDIENIAMAHPSVPMAACVGMPHPKWDERPIVAVVKQARAPESRARNCWTSTKARQPSGRSRMTWCLSMPSRCGATGKMLKTKLRELLKDYRLPRPLKRASHGVAVSLVSRVAR